MHLSERGQAPEHQRCQLGAQTLQETSTSTMDFHAVGQILLTCPGSNCIAIRKIETKSQTCERYPSWGLKKTFFQVR